LSFEGVIEFVVVSCEVIALCVELEGGDDVGTIDGSVNTSVHVVDDDVVVVVGVGDGIGFGVGAGVGADVGGHL